MRVLVTLLLLVLVAVVLYWAWSRSGLVLTGRTSARQRAALGRARWEPAHRQADGRTEVLLRRVAATPDGSVEVLEERAFDQWPDDDPMWEARFAESMANARHRCDVMNAEESS